MDLPFIIFMCFLSVKSSPCNSFLPYVLFIRQRSVCTSEFPKSSFLASEMAILSLFGLVRGGHFVFYADVDDRLATCSYCFQYRQEFRFFGFQTINCLFFCKILVGTILGWHYYEWAQYFAQMLNFERKFRKYSFNFGYCTTGYSEKPDFFEGFTALRFTT